MTKPLMIKHLLNGNAYEKVVNSQLSEVELEPVLNLIQEKLLEVSLGIYYSDISSSIGRLSILDVLKDLINAPVFSTFNFKQKISTTLLMTDLLHSHKYNVSLLEYLGVIIYNKVKSKEITESDAEKSFKTFITEGSIYQDADFKTGIYNVKRIIESEFESIKSEEIKFISNLDEEDQLNTFNDNMKFFEYLVSREDLKQSIKDFELIFLLIIPFYFNKLETIEVLRLQNKEVLALNDIIRNSK